MSVEYLQPNPEGDSGSNITPINEKNVSLQEQFFLACGYQILQKADN